MATVDEMKSRWVYSELGSPRWGEAYAQLKGHTPLLEKATLHVPFSSLSDERARAIAGIRSEQLPARIDGPARQPSVLSPRALDQDPDPRDAHDPPPRVDSVRRISLGAGPKPGEEPTDPREAAKKLGYHPDKWEAAVVVGKRGDYMLLDGYTRAVAYMRALPRAPSSPSGSRTNRRARGQRGCRFSSIPSAFRPQTPPLRSGTRRTAPEPSSLRTI